MVALGLYSGAGGMALGLKLVGVEHVGYVEPEGKCVERLVARIRDGVLSDAPVFHGSVGEFVRGGFAGAYRSVAGELVVAVNLGEYGGGGAPGEGTRERWAEVAGCVCEVGPRVVFVDGPAELGEAGPESFGVRDIFGALAAWGYDAAGDSLSAAAVGAPHEGERVFVVAVRGSVLGVGAEGRRGRGGRGGGAGGAVSAVDVGGGGAG